MAISTLSKNEYAHLIGHLNRLYLSKSNKTQLAERGYTRAQLEELEKARRNFKKDKFGQIFSLNVKYRNCLEKCNLFGMEYFLLLHDSFDRHGTLPYPGSLSEQPAKIMEILDIISAVKNEEEKRHLETMERKQGKNGRRKY